jgi:hypothetical protein
MTTYSSSPVPDAAATWIAHTIVGVAVTAVVGRHARAAQAVAAAFVAVVVHHALDAPLARQLSARGI